MGETIVTKADCDAVRAAALECLASYESAIAMGISGKLTATKLKEAQKRIDKSLEGFREVWSDHVRDHFYVHLPSPEKRYGRTPFACEGVSSTCLQLSFWLGFESEESLSDVRRALISFEDSRSKSKFGSAVTKEDVNVEWGCAVKGLKSPRSASSKVAKTPKRSMNYERNETWRHQHDDLGMTFDQIAGKWNTRPKEKGGPDDYQVSGDAIRQAVARHRRQFPRDKL